MRYNIEFDKEAEKIYKTWGRYDRQPNVNDAVKVYDKLKKGKAKLVDTDKPFTPEQEQKIEEIVNKAIRKIIPKEYKGD